MSGIYIHIPFCNSKCSYCDFYSVARKEMIPEFITALQTEIDSKSKIFKNKTIKTIYFGGGTPSLLSIQQIKILLTYIAKNFNISQHVEITFEANPDNLTFEYLQKLKDTEINRISIGIQSLNDKILKFLRRKHSSKTALKCIENATRLGFNNISIDLIYGIPGLTNQTWINNLHNVLSLPVQHLSAYHLGIEKGTLLFKQFQNNLFQNIDEDKSFQQYLSLIEISNKMGFLQYEISNFSKPSMESKHNSAYWKHIDYLGFGPSAHSFYDNSRSYNVNNLSEYIKNPKNNFEKEHSSKTDLHNEVIMLSLRTKLGLNLSNYEHVFGQMNLITLKKKISKFNNSLYNITENQLNLTDKGMFISDGIIEKLFL